MPLSSWLRSDLQGWARDILLDPGSLGRGYFEPAAVNRLLDRHAAGADGDAKRIYSLLMLELWHREFVDAPHAGPPGGRHERRRRASSSSRRSATRPRTSSASSAPSPRRSCRRRAGSSSTTAPTTARSRSCAGSRPRCRSSTVIEGQPAPAGPVRDRLARAAAPRTFNFGLAAAGDWRAYTHVMKLDGDIEMAPGYLRELIERFEADPQLGLAGGVLDEPTARRRHAAHPDPARPRPRGAQALHAGVLRGHRGVQERLGWDTIDETYARMRGFKVWSFTDLVSIHHRPLGSADGTLRGHARHGECAYIAHFTPTWVALRALQGRHAGARTGCRASPSSTATSGPRPGASSGSQTRNTVGSHTGSCAGGCSARSCHIRGAHNEHRNRRTRLRRAAAGGRVRRGGHRRHRRRRRRRRRSPSLRDGPLAHRGHRRRAAAARARALPLQHALRRAARGRGDPRLRPDAADRQPRARARPAAERRARARQRRARRASRSCSSRRPSPARRASYLVPLLEESGLRAGEDFTLAFSPERVDPGRTDYTLRTTPKVVGGLTDALHRARRRSSTGASATTSSRSPRPRPPS